jgi:hypothetical protein
MRFSMLGASASLSGDDKPAVKAPVAVDKIEDNRWIPVVATLGGGLVGSLLWSRLPTFGPHHPVLGLLNGFALGGNAARAAVGEITPRRAVENIGAHAVATAGALALPSYPWLGYLAGAAGSNLFLRRTGDSYLERLDETVLGGGQETAMRLLGAGGYTDAMTVTGVQAMLKQRGYDLGKTGRGKDGVDGVYGPATAKAIKNVQLQTGQEQTGIIDDTLLKTLGLPLPETTQSFAADVQPETSVKPKTAAKLAVVPKKSGETSVDLPVVDEEGNALIFGQPVWKVALIATGALAAIGGVAYAMGE